MSVTILLHADMNKLKEIDLSSRTILQERITVVKFGVNKRSSSSRIM